ncbi:hypothetical protein OO014_18370 [Intrasporangium calvum]|uniref:Uncharacterized protein n=1 Tax=Intrasporangium calvum TaxID=53358 RepID=A0ABT5GMC3_9MICO|nr:hypothetical protein [Intrasporangium calvum]MDC5699219.1 hypothetical protein [Intrasporangium calvum]
MPPPPLSDLSLVDDVHVRITFEGREGLDDVFLLDLHLDRRGPALDESAYLAALSPVVALVDSTEGCVVRLGREHRLGERPVSAVDVWVSLPTPEVRADDTDPGERSEQREEIEAAVASAFRTLIAEHPAQPAREPAHDEALATARRRVAEVAPEAAATRLTVAAEEHVDGQWSVRLVSPVAGGFEVVVGFVDGHPGTTRLRRLRVDEVVDSVGE